MDYKRLLNLRIHFLPILFTICILIVNLGLLASLLSISDTFETIGLYQDEILIVELPIENASEIIAHQKLNVHNGNHKFNVLFLGAVKDEAYQEYYLDIEDEQFFEDELVHVTFKYNKERIIKKIIKTIF